MNYQIRNQLKMYENAIFLCTQLEFLMKSLNLYVPGTPMEIAEKLNVERKKYVEQI